MLEEERAGGAGRLAGWGFEGGQGARRPFGEENEGACVRVLRKLVCLPNCEWKVRGEV